MFNTKKIESIRIKWLAILVILLVGMASVIVKSASTAPNIPAINLSSDPLYAASGGDKPVLSLALSVEYPTVGAQYLAGLNDTTDATYSNINEYLGYYDAESCYTYNNAPSETPDTGFSTTDYKRFDRSGAASSRMCANAFSGNFLNWATNSAIDMLRLALSGGDRYIDTTSLTILQRAVLPNGDPTCMWNSSNFPAKQLTKNGGGAGQYWGAVPTLMITQANGSDIWVANTLNRIYFGTSKSGSCGNTSAYTLTAAVSTGIGPKQSGTSLPSGVTNCAAENGTCSFSGTKEVWYGANNSWYYAPAANGVACTNANFGDPIVGVAKNCYYRDYSGSWTPNSAAGTYLNTDGFFFSRVNVCTKDSSNTLLDNRDYGLCKVQPSGNYKPTGSIQKYGDQLRLSAFGYLMDQTNSADGPAGRYGGVLRAPMKYVGAKTFDISGVDNTPSSGNPNAEWDPTTGVFKINPDNDTTQTPPISGVINYLNKFGRTGPTPGRYKIYDPVGELYYENLRYLQGLQPTPAAFSNLTASMYDGFPVTTTWTDPYGSGRSNTADYSCLKSNIVVIGDINTHDGNKLPTASDSGNIPDIGYWTGIVQAFERNNAYTYKDGQNKDRTTGNPNTPTNGNPPGNQIVGTAYWGHTHDIRGKAWTDSVAQQRWGLRIKTYLFDVNEYGAQNTASTRQYNNQFFTAAKYGGFETDSSNPGGKPYNAYGNPFKQQDGTNNNNVWQDAANAGEASTYYLQSSARGVLNAFDSIFSRAATAARSIAGSALASKNLTTAGTSIYQGSFDTSDWSGDVLAFPVTVSASNVVDIGGTTIWTASARLATKTDPRNIVVGQTTATANSAATNFLWDEIDADLKTNLKKLTPTSTEESESMGSDRLSYLRGVRTKEGNPFRTRSKLLGDIINSGIVYSGAPVPSTTYDSTYSGFASTNAGRVPALFVGANDGMLHAFKATSGDELFAYIPSWMGPKLAALTSTNYPINHQSYVDATPVVAEAKVGSVGNATDWKTVLVSGTGAGGPGVFALDVTDPSSFSASKVMWEFTRESDVDMGYVVGKPQIVKIRTSAPGAAATYRWFAMVASGVNNYTGANSSGVFSNGNPALFLLALDKAVDASWTAGTNYYKLSLPIDTTLSQNNATGLVNFRVLYGASGDATQVVMGDLHGKVWKVDFSRFGAANWSMTNLSPYVLNSLAYPLYIARSAAGAVQPITMAPTVVSGPIIAGMQTDYVAFATGKYLENSDKTSIAQNSLYVVYENEDTGKADSTSTSRTSVISGRGRLIAGSVSSAGVVTVPAFQWGRAANDGDTAQRSGWYLDFPTSGERNISNMVTFGKDLILNTLIPAASGATGSCAAAGGSGSQYQLDIETGAGTSKTSTVGILGEPMVPDLDSATSYSFADSTGRRIKTTVKQVIQQGSTGLAVKSTTTVTSITGRLSWRQINNYQDLKNTP